MIRRSLFFQTALSLLALITLPMAAANAQQIFKTAPQFAVGTTPFFVASGDFNHDGNPDLAVVNRDDFTVSILLGDGKGGFAKAVNYAVGQTNTFPTAIAVGDLNNDGILDVVVSYALENTGSLSILMGKGDGTFANASTVALPGPMSLVLGDFNGDGKLDVLFASTWDTHSTNLALGNGDGTFQPPAVIAPFATGPLLAADFNGDHKLDVAIVLDNFVVIELGNGDGTFQRPVNYSLEYATGIGVFTAADFNNDGKVDIAAVVSGGTVTGDVIVLLGNGDGTFKEARPNKNALGFGYSSITTGDFDGDGKTDILVNNGSNAAVVLLLGRGDGSFKPSQTWVGGGGAVVAADFNRDGKLDVASCGPINAVSVLLGQGGGTFAAAKAFIPPVNPRSVVTGDFNEDGKSDVAVVTNPGPSDQDGSLNVMLTNKGGNLSIPVGYEVGATAFQAATADLNGDHHLDVVVTNYVSQSVSVLLGNGDGTFKTKTDYAVPGSALVVSIADFNRDGKPDVIVGTYDRGVFLLLGNGDGTFQPSVQVPLPISTITGLVPGDFNGDGKIDVAVTGCQKSCFSTGVLYMLLSNGDGTFQTGPAIGLAPGPDSAAAADLNHDGKLDLVVVTTDCCVDPGYVFVLLGNGDGTFRTKRSYSANEAAIGVVIADFTLDGNLDIAVGGVNSQSLTTLIGKGDGTFTAGPSVSAGLGSSSLALGDFNNDGKPDLAVLGDEGTPSITLLLNQMTGH